MTALNKKILELIMQSDAHLSADELYILCKERGISVSIASIYRILAKFCEEGYIKRLSIQGEPDRFDKNTKTHGHLICSMCGCVEDFELDRFDEYFKEKCGFSIDSYDITVRYICPKCGGKELK